MYKIKTCYILWTSCFTPSHGEGCEIERGRVRERKIEREREAARLEAFWSLPCAHWPDWGQVSPQCSGEPQLYTGRQIHTHSQLGLPVIRGQEGRAERMLSQNHAFINTFTRPPPHSPNPRFLSSHMTGGQEALTGRPCQETLQLQTLVVRGAIIKNTEHLCWK